MVRGVDLDAWVRARVGITNEDGARGHERGVRTCNCPLCDDAQVGRARGWLNVLRGWAGCLNAGCPVEGGMPALEYVRQVEGLRTRTEALVLLRAQFPSTGWVQPLPLAPAAYADWCELPAGTQLLRRGLGAGPRKLGSPLGDEAAAFLRRQWGVGTLVAERWGLGYCTRGRYAWRVIIPIIMGGKLVAFQARSYRNGSPKYLTSAWGKRGEPGAECGRPADAMLFNLDAVTEGSDVILVEGAGDVMRFVCATNGSTPLREEAEAEESSGGGGCVPEVSDTVSSQFPSGAGRWPRVGAERGSPRSGLVGGAQSLMAVALLGTALTDEKAALLWAKKPGRVIVALDADAPATLSGGMVEALCYWGLDAVPGRWDGGKDAGNGARLAVEDVGSGLEARAARRLRLGR